MSRKNVSDELIVCAVAKFQSQAHPHSQSVVEILAAGTGQCEKVCIRAMERALGRDIIDYGVSLRCAFLTEKGEQILAAQQSR